MIQKLQRGNIRIASALVLTGCIVTSPAFVISRAIQLPRPQPLFAAVDNPQRCREPSSPPPPPRAQRKNISKQRGKVMLKPKEIKECGRDWERATRMLCVCPTHTLRTHFYAMRRRAKCCRRDPHMCSSLQQCLNPGYSLHSPGATPCPVPWSARASSSPICAEPRMRRATVARAAARHAVATAATQSVERLSRHPSQHSNPG